MPICSNKDNVIFIYGSEVQFPIKLIFSPLSKVPPIRARAEIYWLLILACSETSLFSIFFPIICKGGKPSFSR